MTDIVQDWSCESKVNGYRKHRWQPLRSGGGPANPFAERDEAKDALDAAMENDLKASVLVADELQARVEALEKALRTCRDELRNHERDDLGCRVSSVTDAIEGADAALAAGRES